jgi:hypothetical protein
VAHNGHRKYDLAESRNPSLSKPHPDMTYASVYRDGEAIGCDYPGDLPKYVVAALYKHLPKGI